MLIDDLDRKMVSDIVYQSEQFKHIEWFMREHLENQYGVIIANGFAFENVYGVFKTDSPEWLYQHYSYGNCLEWTLKNCKRIEVSNG